MDGNLLVSLPPVIFELAHLQILDLGRSHLLTLPPEIGRLRRLLTLGLAENRLQLLPAEIGTLIALVNLYLDGNQIAELPESFAELRSLRALYLHNNEFRQVPAPLLPLTHLTHLSIGRHIAYFPREMARFSKLVMLNVSENPLVEPPPAVDARGAAAVREYFRDKVRETLRGCWVCVVGTGESPSAEELRAARMVGRALAQAGCRLVTGGWPGVDRAAGEAFVQALAQPPSPSDQLLRHVVPTIPYPSFHLPQAEIRYVGANDSAAEMVAEASALVVIGGVGGSYQIYRAAQERGLPVLPLAWTGGDADKIYREPAFAAPGPTAR